MDKTRFWIQKSEHDLFRNLHCPHSQDLTPSTRGLADSFVKNVKCSITFNQHREPVSGSWALPGLHSPLVRPGPHSSAQQRPGTNKQLKDGLFYKYQGQWHLSMGGQSHHNTARIPALCHKLQSHTNKMIIPIFSSSDFLSLIFPAFLPFLSLIIASQTWYLNFFWDTHPVDLF